MAELKRHHFIPEFYLRSFSDEAGRIWIHKKAGGDPSNLSVEEIAFKNDLYTKKTKDGDRDVSNEILLSKIEGISAPIIRKILKEESLEGLTDAEQYDFSTFIILLSERNPQSFDYVDEMMKELYLREWKKGAGKLSDEEMLKVYKQVMEKHPEEKITFEEAKKVILEGPTVDHLVPTHSFGIGSMWQAAKECAGFMLRRNWHLIKASRSKKFILGDDPVLLLFADEEGITLSKGGWGRKSLEIAVPLSPDFLFYASLEEDVSPQMSDLEVQDVNSLFFEQSKNYHLSCSSGGR